MTSKTTFNALTATAAEFEAYHRQLADNQRAAARQRTRDAAANLGNALEMTDAEFAAAEAILTRLR